MSLQRLLLGVVLGAGLTGLATRAEAKLIKVAKNASIQAAIDAAAPGDVIRVGAGKYCGATITKPVVLDGHDEPKIIGCANNPLISGSARAGFYLPGSQGQNPASGTSIEGFVFDGKGVSNQNFEPIAFGIFARYASDVTVANNRFLGTVQAITNTGGDGWFIQDNVIEDLTLFDCTRLCTGGDGIVVAVGRGPLAAPGGTAEPLNRPENNVIAGNRIEGIAPDGFSTFSIVGVLLLSADSTTVLDNKLALRDNPLAAAAGQGILVSNTCCGLGSSFLPGSRNTVIAHNDGRKSEIALVVEGSGGDNIDGLFLYRNRGTANVEGQAQVLARAAAPSAGPARAQPQL